MCAQDCRAVRLLEALRTSLGREESCPCSARRQPVSLLGTVPSHEGWVPEGWVPQALPREREHPPPALIAAAVARFLVEGRDWCSQGEHSLSHGHPPPALQSKMPTEPNREPRTGENCSISRAWFKQQHPGHCFAASQPPALQPRGSCGLRRPVWGVCVGPLREGSLEGSTAGGRRCSSREGRLLRERGSSSCPRRLPRKNAAMSRDRV